MNCLCCGSNNIETGISLGKSTETGNVGLKYNAGIIIGVTQVYADLCLDCGSIVKMYIKDKTNRKWNKKSGVLFSK